MLISITEMGQSQSLSADDVDMYFSNDAGRVAGGGINHGDNEVLQVGDDPAGISTTTNGPSVEVIDLTCLPDLESASRPARRAHNRSSARPSGILSQNRNQTSASDEGPSRGDDGDVVIIDDSPNHNNRKRKLSEKSREQPLATNNNENGLILYCLVCLDEFQLIKNEGRRRITATSCGHLFCNECIDDSIARHGCCPACRKKLTKRSVNVIYM